MRTYFNTNQESGDQLARSCLQARTQQEQILSYFQLHPGRHFTPAEIQRVFPSMLLTSIRRAINNLTPEYLTKTELRTMGLFGKMNFNWRLKQNGGHEQRGLFG